MKSKLSFLARSVIVICMLVVGSSQAWAGNAIVGSWDSWQKHTVSDNKVSVTLEAYRTYEFYLFDSGTSGNESRYFKNYGTMTSSNCSNWKFEEGDNVPNCKITTGTAGTYEFNVSWDGSSPYITVTYPPRTYNGTEVLYLNAGAITWWQDQGVAQYAYITNTSGTTTKLTGEKVEGTSVYAFTVPTGNYTKVYFQRGAYNKTGDINLAGTDKNYVMDFTENGTTVEWDTYTPPVTKFYLSYDGNGATGGTVPATVTNLDSGDNVAVVGNTGSLVKAGYHFDGWNTQADGAGTDYATTSDNASITITANTTLYAKWGGNPLHTVSVTYTDTDTDTKTHGSVRITDIAGVEKTSFREGETVRMIVEPYDGWAIATVSGATATTTPGVYEVTMGTVNISLSVGFEKRVAKCYIYTSTSTNPLFQTPATGTEMTYVSAQKAYYADVNGVSGDYYYRFNYNGVEYSCNWTTYPAGADVTLGGSKVSANKEVATWGNKSACHYNGDVTNIRIWFDPATMQTWITKQGATAAFTPAAGNYDDKMTVRLKITLTEMAATDQTFNYDITGAASKSGSITVPGGTTSASDAIYDITSNGTYNISVKDAESTVIGSATYNVAIITKFDVKVTSKGHGSVSPTNPRVGESSVTITAKPETGYKFKQWTSSSSSVSIADPTSATTTITATSAGTVSAEFEEYEREYYLVGNFFNVDGNNINYDRRYFMFKVQNDGSYMVEIPAAVTAKAQILGVEGSETIHFGPNETTAIYGSDPTTDNSKTGKFASSSTDKYWNLTTRNDGTHDDDGLYEVSFILNDAGEPTDWTWKHVSKKRVAYFLSTAPGATANPIYNSRNGVDAAFSNKTYAMVYIDPAQKYYTIGYVLMNNENDIISKASAYGAHKNRYPDVLPTTNKLFLLGNGGLQYLSHDPNNEVSPNEAPIAPSNKAKATYTVEYNPSNGRYEKAMWDSHLGIRGQFMFIGGQVGGTGADDPITSVSLIGDPVGTWDYASEAHDMKYNEKEGCYEITINTTLPESADYKFRFCANHNPVNTWYEDGTSGTTPKKLARVPYKSEVAQGHSCLPTDPNTVLYSTSNTTANHDIDMIFNRPAGRWTVRLYIDIDQNKKKTYRYTITGKEDRDVTLTLVDNKYIRTYSNSVSMDMPDGMKAYEAYKFEDAYAQIEGSTVEDKDKNVYDKCKVYLRQLKYIPANMGVVLVVDQEELASEATKKFTLQTRIDEDFEDYRDVWVRGEAYKKNNHQWNNFLVPTVTANDKLGNASYDDDGNVTYRYFGLSNYHSTAYYRKVKTGDDYLGFFRLTASGRSGANKAYLSIPSSRAEDWSDEKQRLYGVLNYSAQLSGQETDEETDENGTSTRAKAMILFDDIDFDEEDNIVTGVTSVKQNTDNSNVYYNIQGVRVLAPTKGLYICNGKKIVIK